MNVTADRTHMIHEPYSAPPVRLALKPEGAPAGLLDGAWWPRSRDLLRELPLLTGELEPSWGRITRISVNPAHWQAVPRKVRVDGHVVKAGWFKEQDAHKLLLLSYRVGRWDLLVIPPQTDAATAARLMAAATDPGLRLTASALIAADAAYGGTDAVDVADDADDAVREAAEESRLPDVAAEETPEEAWETEGGAVPKSAPTGAAGRPGPALSLSCGVGT